MQLSWITAKQVMRLNLFKISLINISLEIIPKRMNSTRSPSYIEYSTLPVIQTSISVRIYRAQSANETFHVSPSTV